MPDVKNDLVLSAKIAAFNSLIAGLTGESPKTTYYPEYVQIDFSENQKTILRGMFENSLRSKPGAVRINYNTIFTPPLFKVYGKYAIMLLVIAFLLGKTAK